MVKKNKNGITLDGLAGMVSRRFDEIEAKMVTKDEFNLRFTSLEKKVEKLLKKRSEL